MDKQEVDFIPSKDFFAVGINQTKISRTLSKLFSTPLPLSIRQGERGKVRSLDDYFPLAPISSNLSTTRFNKWSIRSIRPRKAKSNWQGREAIKIGHSWRITEAGSCDKVIPKARSNFDLYLVQAREWSSCQRSHPCSCISPKGRQRRTPQISFLWVGGPSSQLNWQRTLGCKVKWRKRQTRFTN